MHLIRLAILIGLICTSGAACNQGHHVDGPTDNMIRADIHKAVEDFASSHRSDFKDAWTNLWHSFVNHRRFELAEEVLMEWSNASVRETTLEESVWGALVYARVFDDKRFCETLHGSQSPTVRAIGLGGLARHRERDALREAASLVSGDKTFGLGRTKELAIALSAISSYFGHRPGNVIESEHWGILWSNYQLEDPHKQKELRKLSRDFLRWWEEHRDDIELY